MFAPSHHRLFLLACCLMAANVQAQDWSAAGYMPSAYSPQGPVTQATYGPPPGYGVPYSAGPMYSPPHGYGPPQGSPQVTTELVPDAYDSFHNIFYDNDSRLDLYIREVAQGTWMRLEYLNYNISGPQSVPLGVPLQDVEDPTQPFEITGTDDTTILFAKVPRVQGVSLDSLDGIRGSFGIPVTKHAWIEGSAWGLTKATSSIATDALPFTGPLGNGAFGQDPIRLLATTLYDNGSAGSRILIYDQEFTSAVRTAVWSGEVNMVYNLITPQDGLRLQPLVGYRHLQFTDELQFGGSFSNISDLDTGAAVTTDPISNNIQSRANNVQDGVHLGFRSEIVGGWLTLGVEPKFGLSSNRTSATVRTDNLREAFIDPRTANPPDVRLFSLTDPTTITTSSRTELSPSFDLGVYAKLQVNEWLKLKVGYNLLWLGRLSTAENNIYYNDDGDTTDDASNTPGVVVQQTRFTDRVIDGFSIGGEILLP